MDAHEKGCGALGGLRKKMEFTVIPTTTPGANGPSRHDPQHIVRSWAQMSWSDNPWIPDQQAPTLDRKAFKDIAPVAIAELRLKRHTKLLYSMRIPHSKEWSLSHRKSTLARWAIAILVSSPRIPVGRELTPEQRITLRHDHGLNQEFEWTVQERGRIKATLRKKLPDGPHELLLHVRSNGLEWDIEDRHHDHLAVQKLVQLYNTEGLVFDYSPVLHQLPWEASERVKNKYVLANIKKQPFQIARRQLARDLNVIIAKVDTAAQRSPWEQGLLKQSPTELWDRKNSLTNFQIWTAYRLALRQLNLYYEGRQQQGTCVVDVKCETTQETIKHIVWDCIRAKDIWTCFISHWLGHQLLRGQIEMFQEAVAARKAPAITLSTKQKLRTLFGRWTGDMADTYKQIWWIATTIVTGSHEHLA